MLVAIGNPDDSGSFSESNNNSFLPVGVPSKIDEISKPKSFGQMLREELKLSKKVSDIKVNPELSKELTPEELCRLLEGGRILSKHVVQAKLYRCILLWESRGYTENMIANILGKSPRTVRRYQKEMREEQSAYEGADCVKKILANISRRWQAREAYYIHLANTPGLKPMEKLEAMKAAHQVELDMINVVEKFKAKLTQN